MQNMCHLSGQRGGWRRDWCTESYHRVTDCWKRALTLLPKEIEAPWLGWEPPVDPSTTLPPTAVPCKQSSLALQEEVSQT